MAPYCDVFNLCLILFAYCSVSKLYMKKMGRKRLSSSLFARKSICVGNVAWEWRTKAVNGSERDFEITLLSFVGLINTHWFPLVLSLPLYNNVKGARNSWGSTKLRLVPYWFINVANCGQHVLGGSVKQKLNEYHEYLSDSWPGDTVRGSSWRPKLSAKHSHVNYKMKNLNNVIYKTNERLQSP